MRRLDDLRKRQELAIAYVTALDVLAIDKGSFKRVSWEWETKQEG